MSGPTELDDIAVIKAVGALIDLNPDASATTKAETAIRAYLSALPASEAGWRPMSEAPKDGTKILVCYDSESDPYYAEEEGKLTNYGAHAESGDFLDGKGICVAVWVKGWNEPVDEYSSAYMPGWWFAWFNGDTDLVVAPTGWLPMDFLPSAPDRRADA
jgi:hypothetical protein